MMAFLVPYKQTQYTELKISIRIQIQFQLRTNVVLVQDHAKENRSEFANVSSSFQSFFQLQFLNSSRISSNLIHSFIIHPFY